MKTKNVMVIDLFALCNDLIKNPSSVSADYLLTVMHRIENLIQKLNTKYNFDYNKMSAEDKQDYNDFLDLWDFFKAHYNKLKTYKYN